MSPATKTANVLQVYHGAVDNMHQKIQQDREAHMQQLVNAYMEAVMSNMPHSYVTMLEHMIHDRSQFNDRKSGMDAAEWAEHDAKVHAALGSNKHVLTGGASGLQGGGAAGMQGMDYSGKRYNAYLYNLHRKLAHDRSIHAQELANATEQAVELAGGSAYAHLMERMMSDRNKYNARKTALDAAQWEYVEKQVKDNKLHGMLQAGAVCHQKKH